MKRILALLLAVLLCLSVFTGCSKKKKNSSQDAGSLFGTGETAEPTGELPAEPSGAEVIPETTEAPTEAPETEPPTTEPPTEASTTEPPTEPPTTEPPTEAPTEPEFERYYLEIRAGQEIYSGPGYDHRFVAVVEESGTYTIVEERYDRDDNLWGRLRSGVGWVNVTEITYKNQHPEPMTAEYATDYFLSHGSYDRIVIHDSEYAARIRFSAHEKLYNVTFFGTEYNYEYGWETTTEYFFLERMSADRDLVVQIDIGDVATYYLSFEDAYGGYHVYEIYISGMDGSLVFREI